MGITLNIGIDAVDNEDFGRMLKGVLATLMVGEGRLVMCDTAIVKTETMGQPIPTVGGDPREVVAEVGPNPPAGGEASKRRGRPAKPPVTLEATAEPAKAEEAASPEPQATEVATGEPNPTGVGAVTSASHTTPAPVDAATTRKPTIDEARTALKAIAALPNGQELGYSVLAKMNVKNVSEAYVKDAEKFMALCAAKMPAVAA